MERNKVTHVKPKMRGHELRNGVHWNGALNKERVKQEGGGGGKKRRNYGFFY